MPRSDRAPSFLFYPGDYLLDAAVRAMTYDQRGRYWGAVCESWQTKTPGRASEDQWRRWCDYSEEEWTANRAALSAAFQVRPDGTWLQKRTVETRAAQRRRFDQARKGASATNERRWGSVAQRQSSDTTATRQRPDSDTSRVAQSLSLSSSVEHKHGTKNTGHNGSDSRAPGGAALRNGNGHLEDDDGPPPDPTEDEVRTLAERYPKTTVVNAKLARAFGQAVRRHADDRFPAGHKCEGDRNAWPPRDIIDQLKAFAEQVRSDGTERRFIPDATTWLDDDGFIAAFERDLEDEDEEDEPWNP